MGFKSNLIISTANFWPLDKVLLMSVDIPAVILAGGLGTRIREETEFKPKPMVEVGGRPVLWHIMKHLSHFGINRFVICVGYKGDVIRDYFLNYKSRNNDFTVNLGKSQELVFHSNHLESEWQVTVAETGAQTNTGGRVNRIQNFVRGEDFLCTYGDGLADVNIDSLLKFHNNHNKIGTITAVRPVSRFGILEINNSDFVTSFKEKPQTEGWINGGFFIFKPEIFDQLSDDIVLEKEPLQNLASRNQLAAFKHEGFWQPMDTFRESKMLNEMWDTGEAPWRVN
jgi:glucose-1-phosphate cytidylyltransferase